MTRVVIEECRERLRDLQRGFLSQPSSPEAGLMDTLNRQASQQIIATSAEEELDWWRTPDAGYYMQGQGEAVARGVSVQRIFIYRTWTSKHEEIAASQASAGCAVFRIRAERVAGIQNSAFVVWDGDCGIIIEYNSSGSAISSRFTFSRSDIQQLATSFKQMRTIAEPWTTST